MVMLKELQNAHAEWVVAQREFELAAPAFVEAAIHKLKAAELRYNALLKLAKQKGVLDFDKKNVSDMQERHVQCDYGW